MPQMLLCVLSQCQYATRALMFPSLSFINAAHHLYAFYVYLCMIDVVYMVAERLQL